MDIHKNRSKINMIVKFVVDESSFRLQKFDTIEELENFIRLIDKQRPDWDGLKFNVTKDELRNVDNALHSKVHS